MTSPSRNVVPKPRPRPQRTDIVFARPRRLASVAIAFAKADGPVFRYHAISGQDSWSGVVDAATVEAAVLDLISRVRTDMPGLDRARFVVSLPAGSPLWRHAPEVGALLPGVSIEMPRAADQAVMKTAQAALVTEEPAPAPAAVSGLSPVWVATDGSVRGKVTGYGWLASTGEYGLIGFRHSTKQIGTHVVLIAELRALNAAVRKLRGRQLTLLSDSTHAIAMVKSWMAGHDDLPPGYTTERADGNPAGLVSAQRLIHNERTRLTPIWVKGHRGDLLNEGADALARLASRYARGTSELTHADYHRRAAELSEAFSTEFRRTHGSDP